MNTCLKSVCLLAFFFLFVQVGDLDAQYYGKKKKKKKKPAPKEQTDDKPEKEAKIKSTSNDLQDWAFKDRLWYGGGFNLGFNGNQNYSVFQFGLSPMVGYKIIEQWSVGPRIGFNYTYLKGTGSNNRQVVIQPVDFEFGVFTRFKVLPIIFTHVEFTVTNEQQVFVDQFGRIALDSDDIPVTERDTRGNLYLGLGYSADAELGYEFLVLFNLLEDTNSSQLPFSIRAGFNYRF